MTPFIGRHLPQVRKLTQNVSGRPSVRSLSGRWLICISITCLVSLNFAAVASAQDASAVHVPLAGDQMIRAQLSRKANLANVSAFSLVLACHTKDRVGLTFFPFATAIRMALGPKEEVTQTAINCLGLSESRRTSLPIQRAVITVKTRGSTTRDRFQLALTCDGHFPRKTFYKHPSLVQVHAACGSCVDAPQSCIGKSNSAFT